MSDYGVKSTGFVRKPLATTLAELEAAFVTEFGPGVVQTSQSPLGQINGLMADLITELWEQAADVYQSYDPDQAEGLRLDTLGSIRLLRRQPGELDLPYRQAITNSGAARVDIQDLSRAVAAIEGVTYYHVWVNDDTEIDDNFMPPGSVCVAVTGGDDTEIAQAVRQYLVPGVILTGNTTIESLIDGYCRSFRILRPLEIDVELVINVTKSRDAAGCPPPSDAVIRDYLLSNIVLLNGDDINFYRVRSVIESGFANVEVTSIEAKRADEDIFTPFANIGFIERAMLTADNITVNS